MPRGEPAARVLCSSLKWEELEEATMTAKTASVHASVARHSRGMASALARSLRSRLTPRHKVWLNWDGVFLMCPRSLHFLAAVETAGSIRAAGEAVGWSYRTCLNRLRQMERVLGRRMLATTRGGPVGGGARLTLEAHELVGMFTRWQREVDRLTQLAFRRMVKR